jgi:hypothetical protein
LRYPPSQGKSALNRLVNELALYFPTTTEEAKKSLQNGPLGRPRESLVRNFIVVLIKNYLLEDLDDQGEKRRSAALNAIREMHRECFEAVFDLTLNDIMGKVECKDLAKAVRFLESVPDTWQYLKDDVRNRLQLYVDAMPCEQIVPCLAIALDIEELGIRGRKRIASISDYQQISTLLNYHYRDELVDRAIDLFEIAESVSEAEEIIHQIILPNVRYLKKYHIERLIPASNIFFGDDKSIHIPSKRQLINTMRETDIVPAKEFDQLLAVNGLNPKAELLYANVEIPF